MENKYYIPHIDEFTSDFHYEYFNGKVWIKSSDFTNDWDYEDNPHYAVMKGIDNGIIRVKYLDSSDIEELGFTVVKTKGNSFEAVKKFTFTYDNYPSEGEYNIIVSGDKYCVIKLKDIGETTLFRGEIKNKNVLKQVLKMLDIK